MTTLGLPFALVHLLPALPQAAPGIGGGSSMFLFEFAAIIAIMYFLMIRPQQKQRKQHEASLLTLKKGDEVVTSGGVVGQVIHILETSKDGGANRLDDRVTIKSAESRLVVERRSIARIVGTSTGTPSSSATPTT